MDRPFPCSCVKNNVAGLLHLASAVTADSLGHNRVVQLPARSYTLADIWAATQDVAQERGLPLGKVSVDMPRARTPSVCAHLHCASGPVTRHKVSVGALPEDATVKELNVCPAVDCSKVAVAHLYRRLP